MTYPIEELPQEIYSILNNEVQGAVKLESDKLESFWFKYKIEDHTPIYYTKTNLILTSKEDCLHVLTCENSLEKVAEVFLEDSNTYVGVYSYSNCEFLNNLLVPVTEEIVV